MTKWRWALFAAPYLLVGAVCVFLHVRERAEERSIASIVWGEIYYLDND